VACEVGPRRAHGQEDRFGKDTIAETLRRYKEADREVYAQTLAEHEERLGFLLGSGQDE